MLWSYLGLTLTIHFSVDCQITGKKTKPIFSSSSKSKKFYLYEEISYLKQPKNKKKFEYKRHLLPNDQMQIQLFYIHTKTSSMVFENKRLKTKRTNQNKKNNNKKLTWMFPKLMNKLIVFYFPCQSDWFLDIHLFIYSNKLLEALLKTRGRSKNYDKYIKH